MDKRDKQIWFTSDLHLGHANIITYCNRPFQNVQEMNDQLLLNLRTKVLPGDDLYYLGDLTMYDINLVKKFFTCFEDVNIYFVYGNHEGTKARKYIKQKTVEASHLICKKFKGIYFSLCHYPMVSWKEIKKGAFQLHGHSHGNFREFNRQMDVGVDTNDFMPYSLEEIMKKLSAQEVKFADMEGESNDEDR